MSRNNFDLLLMLCEAAESVDKITKSKVESEATLDDHGYASSSPGPSTRSNRTLRPGITKHKALNFQQHDQKAETYIGNRSLHNEKEKSRRADLRGSMNRLKELIPRRSGFDKLTTLQLLRCAQSHIHSLEETERNNAMLLQRLQKKQQQLKAVSAQLRCRYLAKHVKASSECSTASSLSEATSMADDASYSSESDDVDILSCSDRDSAYSSHSSDGLIKSFNIGNTSLAVTNL